MMKLIRSFPNDYRILGMIFILLLILPAFINQFILSLAILIVYWAFLGTAWNIMGGFAGQFSFGHAAFYGIGAYTSTVMLVNLGISPWMGMLVGALLAGLFGLFTGYLSFRYGLQGAYFALATFAFAEMLRLLSSEFELINTSIGIHIPLIGGDSWINMQFEESTRNYYFVVLGLFTFGTLVSIYIARSKLGYYFQAIREDEEAAAALGVDILRYKVVSVVISAALTAMGGSFFIQYFFYVNPDLAFGVPISIEILLRPVIGGVGTVWGPLVGALFLTPLAELTRAFVRTPPEILSFIEGRAGVDVMLFGLLLIAIIIFVPDGIVGGMKRAWQWIRRRFS